MVVSCGAGLVVGPLFLVAEAAFHFHLRLDVKAAIDARLGNVQVHSNTVAPA